MNTVKQLSKPYVKKLEQLDDITVWQVDGQYIRDNLNREFTNFGQHFRFPFIPKHEFWIDHEHGTDETKFFIDHLLVEWQRMNEGVEYDDALGQADAIEQKERNRVDFLMQVEKQIDSLIGIVPTEVYDKKLLTAGDVEVFVVNGRVVRDIYFIDFTEGGHHFVYDFVPLNEVWLDDDLAAKERDYVLLHELHERYLMANGMDYDSAHRSSSLIEYKCRRKKLNLKKCIQDEVVKNEKLAAMVTTLV
jgi:hypothetical protein